MKASEFITLLEQKIREEGDCELVMRVGEMNDPEFVSGVEPCGADITQYGTHRSLWIPYLSSSVPNSKVFMIESSW